MAAVTHNEEQEDTTNHLWYNKSLCPSHVTKYSQLYSPTPPHIYSN